MRRPASRRAKANYVAQLLTGRGVHGVKRDITRGEYIDLPDYQIRVAGLLWHAGKKDPTILREMRREKATIPVAIRLVDPEIEMGLVVMTVDEWIDLMVRAQT